MPYEVTAAMSRTSTATWKNVRDQRRKHDQDNGVTNCPDCGVYLNWEHGRIPNSAEVDHVIPHSQGGQDVFENTRTCCRRCNQSTGGKIGGTRNAQVQKKVEYQTAIQW